MIPVKGKKIKLTKLRAVEGRPMGLYEPGESHIGKAMDNIEKGDRFVVMTLRGVFVTSTVTEILPSNQFQTNNSIYQYELMEEDGELPNGRLGKTVPVGPDVPTGSGRGREKLPPDPHRRERRIVGLRVGTYII